MRTALLLMRLFVVPLCVGFVLALVASAVVQVYLQTKDNTERARTVSDLAAGLRAGTSYTTYLTILSYDPASRTLIASVRSAVVNQDVPQRLKLSDTFGIERRDAIVENGMIVGTKPLVYASLDALTPGAHGLGTLTIADGDLTRLEYLLIGDPFPRP